jgi:hypothetical protein
MKGSSISGSTDLFSALKGRTQNLTVMGKRKWGQKGRKRAHCTVSLGKGIVLGDDYFLYVFTCGVAYPINRF